MKVILIGRNIEALGTPKLDEGGGRISIATVHFVRIPQKSRLDLHQHCVRPTGRGNFYGCISEQGKCAVQDALLSPTSLGKSL